jgi:hypothetical protein
MEIELFLGIDNSHTGALALIDKDGSIVDFIQMPVKDGLVQYQVCLDFLFMYGQAYNTRVMLEEPHKFAKGINAVRIMWSCFERLRVAFELNDMQVDCILPNQWQTKMLEVYGDKKSKEWAEKRVEELWGDAVKKSFKSKKSREGINDALLIAEFCRRSHLGLPMP